MKVHRRTLRMSLASSALLISLCPGLVALPPVPAAGAPPAAVPTTNHPHPEAYGINQETVTSIFSGALTSFSAAEPITTALLNATYVRYIDSASASTFLGAVSIPSGAVIDYLGISNCDATGAHFGAYLVDDTPGGAATILGPVQSTPRSAPACGIDYNSAPFAYAFPTNEGHNLQIAISQASGTPLDGTAGVQSLEIWWHLQVSPAPATATFNDVPTNDPGFQYIEALAASGITAGCGGGNYCPDNPVTRRQMAIFLAKALGLNWPH